MDPWTKMMKNWKHLVISYLIKGPEYEYYPTGKVKTIKFKDLRGKLHRVGTPALIAYDKRGRLKLLEYYDRDKLHRSQKPAVMRFLPDGMLGKKEYYRKGERHRKIINGVQYPAIVVYFNIYYHTPSGYYNNEDPIHKKIGQIQSLEYYVRGLRHRYPVNGKEKPAKIRRDTQHDVTHREYYNRGEYVRFSQKGQYPTRIIKYA